MWCDRANYTKRILGGTLLAGGRSPRQERSATRRPRLVPAALQFPADRHAPAAGGLTVIEWKSQKRRGTATPQLHRPGGPRPLSSPASEGRLGRHRRHRPNGPGSGGTRPAPPSHAATPAPQMRPRPGRGRSGRGATRRSGPNSRPQTPAANAEPRLVANRTWTYPDRSATDRIEAPTRRAMRAVLGKEGLGAIVICVWGEK